MIAGRENLTPDDEVTEYALGRSEAESLADSLSILSGNRIERCSGRVVPYPSSVALHAHTTFS